MTVGVATNVLRNKLRQDGEEDHAREELEIVTDKCEKSVQIPSNVEMGLRK